MSLKCHGCQSNLAKATEIPLKMIKGILVVTCPLCRFNNTAKTDDRGNVVILANEKTGKTDAPGN